MPTVASFGVRLGLDMAQYEAGLTKAQAATKRFEAGVNNAMGKLSVAAVGATAAATALGAAFKQALDFAGGIGDMAQQVNVSREEIQSLGYAASMAGVSTEEFNAGLTKFATTIGKAAEGSKAQIELFERLGVRIRTTQGEVRDTDDVMRDFADALVQVDSDAQRAAITAEAFGKAAGPKLAVLLREGSEGIKELETQARQAGAVVSDGLIRQAEEAGDKLDTLAQVIRAQTTVALVQLTPVITAVGNAFSWTARKLNEFIEAWQDNSQQQIAAQMGLIESRIEDLGRKIEYYQSQGNMAEVNEGMERHIKLLERLGQLRNQYRQVTGIGSGRRGANGGGDGQSPPVVLLPPAAGGLNDSPNASRNATREGRYVAGDYLKALDRAVEEGDRAFREMGRDTDRWVREGIGDLQDYLEASTSETVKAIEDMQASIEDTSQTISDSLFDALASGAANGSKSAMQTIKAMIVQMGLEFAKAQLKQGITSLITSFFGAASGGGAGFAKSSSSIGTGAPKFATGGSFVVPGPPTGDRIVPQFRVNGGETVTVTPKGKSAGGVTIVQHINAQGANQQTVQMIEAASRRATREAVAEVINMLQRGRT